MKNVINNSEVSSNAAETSRAEDDIPKKTQPLEDNHDPVETILPINQVPQVYDGKWRWQNQPSLTCTINSQTKQITVSNGKVWMYELTASSDLQMHLDFGDNNKPVTSQLISVDPMTLHIQWDNDFLGVWESINRQPKVAKNAKKLKRKEKSLDPTEEKDELNNAERFVSDIALDECFFDDVQFGSSINRDTLNFLCNEEEESKKMPKQLQELYDFRDKLKKENDQLKKEKADLQTAHEKIEERLGVISTVIQTKSTAFVYDTQFRNKYLRTQFPFFAFPKLDLVPFPDIRERFRKVAKVVQEAVVLADNNRELERMNVVLKQKLRTKNIRLIHEEKNQEDAKRFIVLKYMQKFERFQDKHHLRVMFRHLKGNSEMKNESKQSSDIPDP